MSRGWLFPRRARLLSEGKEPGPFGPISRVASATPPTRPPSPSRSWSPAPAPMSR